MCERAREHPLTPPTVAIILPPLRFRYVAPVEGDAETRELLWLRAENDRMRRESKSEIERVRRAARARAASLKAQLSRVTEDAARAETAPQRGRKERKGKSAQRHRGRKSAPGQRGVGSEGEATKARRARKKKRAAAESGDANEDAEESTPAAATVSILYVPSHFVRILLTI